MSAVLDQQPSPAPAKTEFEVALRFDDQLRAKVTEGSGLVAVAEACEVNCYDMAVIAQSNLNTCIAFRKGLEATKKDFIDPAMKIIDRAKALFNPGIDGAQRAEEIYRKKLADYQAEERRKQEEARRAREEAERKAREEAERAAAAARARAEEQARKAREEAAKAERERREAEERARQARAAGDREAAAKAEREAAARAAEQARREEEERQRREAGEREANRLQMEAAARTDHLFNMPQTAPAVGGSREDWHAEVDPENKGNDDDERLTEAKKKISIAIASGRTELLTLIDISWKAANKMAGAQKKVFNVPGLVAKPSTTFVNTKRKGK